jgi:hypothetical protein
VSLRWLDHFPMIDDPCIGHGMGTKQNTLGE